MLVALLPAPALACGALASPDGRAELDGWGAVLVFDGQSERLITTIAYHSDTDFVWLMALPAKPDIAVDDTHAFTVANYLTVPPRRTHPHVGIGAAPPGADAQELSRQQVGSLDFLTLQGTTAEAVGKYLDAQGFHLHGLQQSQVQAYLDRHWVLTAAKAHPGSLTAGGLQPISFTFASQQAVYPMGLLKAPDTGDIPARLYLITPWRPHAVGGERAISPDENGAFALGRDQLDFEYADRFHHPDYANETALINALGVPRSSWLTRYEARWSAAANPADLTFEVAPQQVVANYDALQAKYDREFNQESVPLIAAVVVLIGAVLLGILIPIEVVLWAIVGVVLLAVWRSQSRARRDQSR